MSRIKTLMLAAATLAVLGPPMTAAAEDADKAAAQPPATRGPQFVDEDGNGICDRREADPDGRGPNFVDNDGDGVCDNWRGRGRGRGWGRRAGRGPAFVDEDGNGLCDQREADPERRGPGFVDKNGDGVCDNWRGRGRGRGWGRRAGRGPAFVDEDGNGLCDRREKASDTVEPEKAPRP